MRLVVIFGSCLVSVGFNSCAVIPGEARRPEKPCKCCFHEAEPCNKSGLAKLNPVWWLGNENRPYDPWFKPELSHEKRAAAYKVRNPGHNFTYFVIGVADRDFTRSGNAPDSVWNPDGGTNLTLIHAGPLIHLPCISHKGRFFEGYVGWRERGNFGLALRLADPDELPRNANPDGFGEGEKRFRVRKSNPCVMMK